MNSKYHLYTSSYRCGGVYFEFAFFKTLTLIWRKYKFRYGIGHKLIHDTMLLLVNTVKLGTKFCYKLCEFDIVQAMFEKYLKKWVTVIYPSTFFGYATPLVIQGVSRKSHIL